MAVSMIIVFTAFAVVALVLCAVAQVKTAREETARLKREEEELRERFGGFDSDTPYR
jgi:hypothetical protein